MSSSLEAVFVYGVLDDPACWNYLKPLPVVALALLLFQASPFAVSLNVPS